MQADDYYPFGARFAQSPERVLKNRYLYQGKELGQELGLGLYDFHARQYDPLLGRFTSVDPASQFASGYTGMGNNLVNMVDPDGRFAGLLSAMFGGALVGANNAYQSGGNPWQGAAQGAFGAGITAGLGMLAPSGALGAVYNAGVSALAGGAMSGDFSGFGTSMLNALPGAFMSGVAGSIDQSVTASRERAFTNSYVPDVGGCDSIG